MSAYIQNVCKFEIRFLHDVVKAICRYIVSIICFIKFLSFFVLSYTPLKISNKRLIFDIAIPRRNIGRCLEKVKFYEKRTT